MLFLSVTTQINQLSGRSGTFPGPQVGVGVIVIMEIRVNTRGLKTGAAKRTTTKQVQPLKRGQRNTERLISLRPTSADSLSQHFISF